MRVSRLLSPPPTSFPFLAIPPKLQRLAVTLVQIAITAGILTYLLHDPVKRHEMAETLLRARGWWVLAGIGAYGAVECLAALRWKLLLHVQGIDLRPLRLTMLVLIGVFFNFFIPGGTGGDVVRVFYLLREAPERKSAAVLSVLVDRIIGLFALIALACIFIGLRWSWLTSTPSTRGYVWMTLSILAVASGGVVFSVIASGLGLVHKLPMRLPGRDRIAEFALAYNHYARAWPATLAALLGSMISHLGYIFTFFCASKAIESPLSNIPTYGELCTIMPVVNTITALPISLGGMGVREGLFQVFLNELVGVEKSVAVVISSLGFLLSATWGALGGLIYIVYRPSEHARMASIRAEVAALEHTVAESERAMEVAGEEAR